ncbi:MAG: UDP-N-acetylmuramate--L-alanine ligase [Clostridia bacterium]|nr:UDP-N-acetylmuramate--L-alanine ligase [Clostridia bacterium]
MSAIAMQLKHMGFNVMGTDAHISSIADKLKHAGIEVREGDAPEFVKQCDVCIKTAAIGDDNEDVKLLKMLNKPIYSRAEVLGYLSMQKKCIAVSGTHGKTTTTGMLASVMLKAGLDPTVHIGGILNDINSNLHIGEGEYFLTEACEYKDSFLALKPFISVVLNIESDHMDYFKNLDNLYNSFKKFAKNTQKYGFCVINNQIIDKFSNENHNILTFGDDGFLKATNVKQHLPGRFCYDLHIDNQYAGHIQLAAFGKHNVQNSLAVIAVSLLLDIDLNTIKEGLIEYKGVARRMELISNTPFVIHDYAHHPTEIKATIDACRNINKDVIVVFQPHLYSRTRDLYEEFLTCFNGAKEVWLLPIYAARETSVSDITSKGLAKDLCSSGVISRYFNSFESCQQEIIKVEGDILFAILGAGDIVCFAESLKKI